MSYNNTTERIKNTKATKPIFIIAQLEYCTKKQLLTLGIDKSNRVRLISTSAPKATVDLQIYYNHEVIFPTNNRQYNDRIKTRIKLSWLTIANQSLRFVQLTSGV